MIASRDNTIVKVLDVPLMYSVQVALRAEAWRAQHGAAVRGWLDATGEMEALLSLSAYHYEHPLDILGISVLSRIHRMARRTLKAKRWGIR